MNLSDFRPGLAYGMTNGMSAWIVVSIEGLKRVPSGNPGMGNVQYLDFTELAIDGPNVGKLSEVTLTFVDETITGYELFSEGA